MLNRKIKRVFLSIFSFVLGIVIGAIANIYLSLPESNFIPEKTKLSSHYEFSAGEIDVDVINESELSMHFLELGNKYTGDCIYIKVGETDILVDGGSKTSSISTIKNYD